MTGENPPIRYVKSRQWPGMDCSTDRERMCGFSDDKKPFAVMNPFLQIFELEVSVFHCGRGQRCKL